jgi:hypothetical protein
MEDAGKSKITVGSPQFKGQQPEIFSFVQETCASENLYVRTPVDLAIDFLKNSEPEKFEHIKSSGMDYRIDLFETRGYINT